jgi:hypothetical protein
MPLDAPPPLMSQDAPPAPPPSNVDALSSFAGMGAEGQTVGGLAGTAGELLVKAIQVAQAQGDQQSIGLLLQALDLLTNVAMAQQQGVGAGPMASNGMGAPPPGPPGAGMPPMMSPGQQTPTPMMLPRSSMMP